MNHTPDLQGHTDPSTSSTGYGRTKDRCGPAVVWLRRDLRLNEQPAIAAAAARGRVLPVVVLDPKLAVSPARRARYRASVSRLADDIARSGGALLVLEGDPRTLIPRVAAKAGADSVDVTGEHTPLARRRDKHVADALATQGVTMRSHGSCHALTPGSVLTKTGTPYKVFSPFFAAWRSEIDRLFQSGEARADQQRPRWAAIPEALRREALSPELLGLSTDSSTASEHPAGERAALRRWQEFRSEALDAYASDRNRPDVDGTSSLSVALRLGEVHPHHLIADLVEGLTPGQRGDDATETFLSELAWRDFYADVLWHRPETAWSDLRTEMSGLEYNDVGPDFDAWRTGTTGYPLVDAGMRQLLATGWMHNRVRMVTASFLVKDLHLPWQVGAAHFLEHLLDGDIASNNHSWQWAAGTGTDASPYHRVFNPTLQAKRFDPQGDYVRTWVPELRHIAGARVHEPWKLPDGLSRGYLPPIVDHDEERRETLERWDRHRGR